MLFSQKLGDWIFVANYALNFPSSGPFHTESTAGIAAGHKLTNNAFGTVEFYRNRTAEGTSVAGDISLVIKTPVGLLYVSGGKTLGGPIRGAYATVGWKGQFGSGNSDSEDPQPLSLQGARPPINKSGKP